MNGLKGTYKLPEKITLGEGEDKWTYRRAERLMWTVRWDTDETKGPHVNAQFGKSPRVKYSFRLLPDAPQYVQTGNEATRANRTMDNIEGRLNDAAGWVAFDNRGRAEPVYWMGPLRAIKDLRDYFRRVATGDPPYRA